MDYTVTSHWVSAARAKQKPTGEDKGNREECASRLASAGPPTLHHHTRGFTDITQQCEGSDFYEC